MTELVAAFFAARCPVLCREQRAVNCEDGSYQLTHANNCLLGTSTTHCAKNRMKKWCFHSSGEDFQWKSKTSRYNNIFGRNWWILTVKIHLTKSIYSLSSVCLSVCLSQSSIVSNVRTILSPPSRQIVLVFYELNRFQNSNGIKPNGAHKYMRDIALNQ